MEAYAYKWFVVYYFMLSLSITTLGAVWLFVPAILVDSFRKASLSSKPPIAVIRVLKYGLLTSLISLILAFFPFQLKHVAHVLWVWSMIFIVGRFLVNWENFCLFWKERESAMGTFFQKSGALFFFSGIATSILLYYSI